MQNKALYPEAFDALMSEWTQGADKINDDLDKQQYFVRALPELLKNRPMVRAVLGEMIDGDLAYRLKPATIFENELIVYMDPLRGFSVRFYLFRPREFTFIHDHNSWGVSGSSRQHLSVIRYRRTDNGSRDDCAKLEISEELEIRPGEVSTTLPFNQGIHQTGNRSDQPMLMISVYGSPTRRHYIQRFNPGDGSIRKMFPPKMLRQELAERILDTLA